MPLWLSAIINFVASYLRGRMADRDRDADLKQLGRTEVESAQAKEAERVQAELADQAATRTSEDDAIARLERGEA